MQTDFNPIKLAICLCTRRRQDGLVRLLDSFMTLEVPQGTEVRIIIVENDSENRCEDLILNHPVANRFEVRYFLERKQGVVFARNRSVAEAEDCDFCCFTDDDETVDKNWLLELLRCQIEFDADGVAGPTIPSFDKELPAFIKEFHVPVMHSYGTKIDRAYTGCLLLRRKCLDAFNGPFDPRFNFTGGEDSCLTYRISSSGGTIRFNPLALAYEPFPESRTTIKYMIGRKYATSNSAMMIDYFFDGGFSLKKSVVKLSMRLVYGVLITIPYLVFSSKNRLKGVLKIVGSFGAFSFILGKRTSFYK